MSTGDLTDVIISPWWAISTSCAAPIQRTASGLTWPCHLFPRNLDHCGFFFNANKIRYRSKIRNKISNPNWHRFVTTPEPQGPNSAGVS